MGLHQRRHLRRGLRQLIAAIPAMARRRDLDRGRYSSLHREPEKVMQLSPAGEKFIEGFEGFSLIPYLDQRGIPTVGWGHTGKEVRIGDAPWTLEQCQIAFEADVAGAEHAVNLGVAIAISQNQFDALVDFTFNEGIGAFLGSTLRKYVNSDQIDAAASQLLLWDKTHVNGVLTEVSGLKRRREAEHALFLTA